MPPKKTATGTKAATTKKPAAHASYQDMIKEAIISLKERNGSSRQSLKKYVLANNDLGSTTDNAFTTQFNKALQKGSESGVFARPKGTSGPVKLASKTTDSKPAAKTTKAKDPVSKKIEKESKTTKTKKPAAAKKATTTKAAATKKAPAKKTAAAKTATKKTTTKANSGTKRKTSNAAPAVEEKAPVVLGKTKSGRVTKSSAPQPSKATKPKKAAAKKATPKKAKTPTKA